MSSKKVTWQQLERAVRNIAEAKFGAVARAEDISGVKCDCVIHLAQGAVVIIEISKESSIEKLRIDLAKFNVIRPHFFSRNIFPRCFFICLEDPTPALIDAGKQQFVAVQSVSQFFQEMLGRNDYIHLRRAKPFGSAVDLYSGKPDLANYVPVVYFSEAGTGYSAREIAIQLIAGKAVILLGDYGSGKSRCTKEVFEILTSTYSSHYKSPLAINLRENWGLKRAEEVITRHFTDLGLNSYVAEVLKTAFEASTIFLLDGFDEIGAQTWSDDPTRLVEIRRQSLVGVKDLVQHAHGGILITGREHYFNDDAEMIECLGVAARNPLILRCNPDLDATQFATLVGLQALTLPGWLPRKPLIGTIIRSIEPNALNDLLSTATGQVDFWDLLLQAFCEREAAINPILDPNVIRNLYSQIGRIARTTTTALGPISIKSINQAFELCTGRPPTDESAIILQRLPGLSRIGAESLDRQFVDTYILDGLKAEDIHSIYTQSASSAMDESWRHPIEGFGSLFLAARIEEAKQAPGVAAFIKRHIRDKNKVALSDLISALALCSSDNLDMSNITLEKGKFYCLALGTSRIRSITFYDCTFDNIDFSDVDYSSVKVQECVLIRVDGVASKDHLPTWVVKCECESFQSVNTLALIKKAGLNQAQTFLLSSLRKLFLQPGSGRKYSSMFKGYSDAGSKRVCEKVINILVREKLCRPFRGSSEDVYIPDRGLTGRVRAIMSEMTQSKDPIWIEVSKINVD